jgi:hypothetical protein
MSGTGRRPLTEVAGQEQVRLADDPNIDSVGYGLRRRGGVPLYEVCVQYHVRVKLADPDQIRAVGSEVLPAEVGGYPTDVMETVAARPCKNEGPPTGSRGSHIDNPLIGGGSTTVLSDWHSFPTGFGTLGGLCFDSSNGDAMALSNAHVWGLDADKDCIQPWIPTGEYLTALLKLLTCGPAAFILDDVVPSPLTAGLAAAAAGAWVAAALSDAEDPSRWGQRTGPQPGPAAVTTAETIQATAAVPDFPFAGRAYSAKTRWDYTRHTSAGNMNAAIEADRANEHILRGKLVWTERDTYSPGERVDICAEVITDRVANPAQLYVVAMCYPESNPERVLYRVLRPGRCKGPYRAKPICLEDFPDPLPSFGGSGYTIDLNPFRFESGSPARVMPAQPGSPLEDRNLLELPSVPLRMVFPPSTLLELETLQPGRGLQVIARNSAGQTVATAKGSGGSPDPATLTLRAPEMVEAVISGGGDGSALAGICVTKRPDDLADEGAAAKLFRLPYVGELDLGFREPKSRWNIVLQVQSLDPSGPKTDPVSAARVLGGITASANVLGVGCIVVMLLDHVFDVI